jgi:hypothetical protein
MSSNFNYSVSNGNNKFEIVFAEGARFQVVSGDFTRVRGILNALTNIASGRGFQHVEVQGLLLNSSLDAYVNVVEKVKAGYCYGGPRLAQLIADGIVRQNGDIVPWELYRLIWDGVGTFNMSLVEHRKYEEGEAEWLTHNRNAVYLCQAYQVLARAQEAADEGNPFNIRLIYTGKFEKYADAKAELLGLTGKTFTPEEVAAEVDQRVLTTQVKQTLKAVSRKTDKPEVSADETLPLVTGGEILAWDLVGNRIEYWGNAGCAANRTMVTAENLVNVVATVRKRGMKVAVVAEG